MNEAIKSIKTVKSLDELKKLNEGDLVSLDFKPKIYLRADGDKIVFLDKRDGGMADILAEMYVPEDIIKFYEDGSGPEINWEGKRKIRYRTLLPPSVFKKYEKIWESKKEDMRKENLRRYGSKWEKD